MRPITVSVGPLAAASANAIVNNQTATVPGQVTLFGGTPPGGAATGTTIAGTITNGVLSITGPGGVVVGPGSLSAVGLPPNAAITGPAPGSVGNGVGSTWIVSPTVANLAIAAGRLNWLITLDAPRQLVVTTTQAAPGTLTIYGFDAAGSPMQETLAYSGGNLTTQQNFKAVTQVVTSVPATVTVGTAATATSQWVNFDPWARGTISYQADLAGAANYTVQITNDDPNSPTNPVAPGQMAWLPDPNATLVGATTPQAAYWSFTPLWARVLLNSGAGAVSATFVQQDGGR